VGRKKIEKENVRREKGRNERGKRGTVEKLITGVGSGGWYGGWVGGQAKKKKLKVQRGELAW
jgi:hypothetical protein